MAGQLTNALTKAQQGLLDRLLEIGWILSGVSPDETDHDIIDKGFRQIFVASEMIDDLQDAIQPVETAELNRRMNDALDTLFSGLRVLPRNCLPHAMQCIHTAISGQKQDVSRTIAQGSMSHADIADHCEEVSRQKTGSLIQLAFTLPWLSRNEEADSPPDVIADLGTAAGVAIQALNDWKDLQPKTDSETDSEDVFHGRVTWVWEWLSAECAKAELKQLRTDAEACIKDRQLARVVRDRLADAVDENSYLQLTQERYRIALARVSSPDAAGAGAKLESILFDQRKPQRPEDERPAEGG